MRIRRVYEAESRFPVVNRRQVRQFFLALAIALSVVAMLALFREANTGLSCSSETALDTARAPGESRDGHRESVEQLWAQEAVVSFPNESTLVVVSGYAGHAWVTPPRLQAHFGDRVMGDKEEVAQRLSGRHYTLATAKSWTVTDRDASQSFSLVRQDSLECPYLCPVRELFVSFVSGEARIRDEQGTSWFPLERLALPTYGGLGGAQGCVGELRRVKSFTFEKSSKTVFYFYLENRCTLHREVFISPLIVDR